MGDIRHLDRKVKVLWFLPTGLILIITMLVGLFLDLALSGSYVYGISKMDFAIMSVFIPLALGAIVYGWLHVNYHGLKPVASGC